MLKVSLLGKFEVRQDGNPVNIPSRPAQSLLAYLVLNPGIAHRRERLAGLLSPDSTEENARSALRHALWRIRKALENDGPVEGGYLIVDEIAIAFNAKSEFWLDVARLERKTSGKPSLDDLVEAVSVYAGDLLPGFYDDWVVLERERLQAIFQHKMKLLLDQLVAARRWEDVFHWSERWIALGHAPEPAYNALMIAHAGSGDFPSALATYRRCEDALINELGVEPSAQTRALYEQLLTGELPPALAPTEVGHQLSTLAAGTEDELPAPGEPPYKGLHYYEEDDADLFFGRELLTASLVAHLRTYPFLAVIGASGSGKSSIVRAGLIPALRSEKTLADNSFPPEGSRNWPVHIITPTAHPLQALAVSLTQHAETLAATATLIDDLRRDPRSLGLAAYKSLAAGPTPRASRILLVVDQFEELFTLCRDEEERKAFIDNLTSTVQEGGVVDLVIALRADFYAHCANYASLRKELAEHQEYIGSMSAEEVRRTIDEPARRGRWVIEPGLVDLMVREVADEPGALPLLSHALLETWIRRRGRALTIAGYAESGGVSGAIARTAESVYQRLTPQQQEVARLIFLRLTELGEDTGNEKFPPLDTRRRALLSELTSIAPDGQLIEPVLKTLVDARLISVTQDTAEVTHEAIIRAWPTLRQWLAEDRDGLQLHRSLTDAAQEWDDLERDPGGLWRGARLAQAVEWAGAHPKNLNALERDYLAASKSWAESEAAEREAQRQRELEVARKLADAEKMRAEQQVQAAVQLRRRAVYLSAAFVLALALAGVALYLGSLARQNAQEALAASRLAASRELAAAAMSNLAVDPERSILLALQAVTETYPVSWTVEAENALHSAIQASRVELRVGNGTSAIGVVAYNPDGSRFATGSVDGTVRVWDAISGDELSVIPANEGVIPVALAFNPSDGTRLAVCYIAGPGKVWNLNGNVVTQSLEPCFAVAYSPDGRRIYTGDTKGDLFAWDASSAAKLLTIRTHTVQITDIAVSPDNTRLASAGYDGLAHVWDTTTGAPLITVTASSPPVKGIEFASNAVAFSPDDKHLATASADYNARVWDATTGQLQLVLGGHAGAVSDVAYSPDGGRLATSGSDGMINIWDSATGQVLFTLAGHSGRVYALAFSPDGTRLLSAGYDDGTARVWNVSLSREVLTLGTNNNFAKVAYSPDGTRLAAGYGESQAKIWDAASGRELQTLLGHTGKLMALAFSPDGAYLATAADDAKVVLWNVVTGQNLGTFSGHTAGILDLAFSPDGSRLATSSLDLTIKLWEVATRQVLLTIQSRQASFDSLAFSPDGKRLAASNAIGNADVWDISGLLPASLSPGQEKLVLSGHSGDVWDIRFGPDGTLLATAGDDGKAILWDASSGKELLTFTGHKSGVQAVAFSPDGTQVATASRDGTVRVWDDHTGREILTLSVENNVFGANGVVFSPDGKRLVASTADQVRVYFPKMDDLMALGRSRVTRSLSLDECRLYLHVSQCPATPGLVEKALVPSPSPNIPQTLPKPLKGRVCQVSSIEGDYFAAQANQGLQTAVNKFGWESAMLVTMQPDDLKISLQWHCDLIITTIYSLDLVRTVAAANPGQKFEIFDYAYDQPLQNLWTEVYASDQAAFLAGYVAASVTKTGKVGVFGAFDIPPVTDFMDGFALGVDYYNQKTGAQVKVLGWDVNKRSGLITNTFDIREAGNKAAQQLLDQGADIILPVAGNYVGSGAAEAVMAHGRAYLIGVDTDWVELYPEYADILLTSILKRVDISVLHAVQAIVDGKFSGGQQIGNLENGGVGIADFHNLDKLVSPEVKADLEQIKAGIINGTIKTLP